MAYRLKANRPFSDEFHRIAGRELDKAIAVLEHQPDGPATAIHMMRRHLKKARALYRFVSPAAKTFRRTEDRRLRDAARSVAHLRDATALIDTVEILRDRMTGSDREAAERAIDALHARKGWVMSAESDLPGRIGAVIETLRAAGGRVEKRDFRNGSRPTAHMIAASWCKAIERAQLALSTCHKHPTADNFHTLRKRTQDYRFYHLLLEEAWPGALIARERVVKALIDRLGLLHDFAVLSETLAQEPQLLAPEDLAILRHAIGLEIKTEESQALAQADALLTGSAGQEAERVAILWLVAA